MPVPFRDEDWKGVERERGGVCLREREREREARERDVKNPAQICQTIYCTYGTWYTIYTPRSFNRP